MPFFTPNEKENLEKWNYQVIDNSISTKLLTPFWNWAVTLIPEDVAPNILSLAGLLCILQSYYLTYLCGASYPSYHIVIIGFLFLFYLYIKLSLIKRHDLYHTDPVYLDISIIAVLGTRRQLPRISVLPRKWE